MPECLKVVNAVRNWRENEGGSDAKKLADRPTHFHVENIPNSDYLIIPRVSGETRLYVPIGFMSSDALPSDSVHVGFNATIYHFGILTSNVHNYWMRYVCGRLESRYRYSKEIVYNNFPWPICTPEQKSRIESTAKGILDARAAHDSVPLKDLYDNKKGKGKLFTDLIAAHKANDKAVMDAYGYDVNMTEKEIVIDLMNRYQDLFLTQNE